METEEEKNYHAIFKYQKIFNYFGYENQRSKLTEEAQELSDEILLYEKGIGDINKIIEEMADLRNILLGFILEYDIHPEEINNIMDIKLDRTIERINCGYYENK